jgi:hypothetical protein
MMSPGYATSATSEVLDRDLGEALRRWTELADRLDRIDLALQLIEATPQSPDLRLMTARLRLLAGQPTQALESLGSPMSESWMDAGTSADHATAAACLAATGNDEAFRALLAAAAGLAETPAAVFCAYLVASAAEARGAQDLADQAWTSLVLRHGVRTNLTVSRWATAELRLRDSVDGVAVLRSLAKVSTALEHLVHRLESDPQPAVDAANGLLCRGDTAGARLLLDLLMRRNGKIDRLRIALAKVTPKAAMRRYRLLTWTLIAAWMPFIWLGIIWIALSRVGRYWFRKRVKVPGFGRADSQAWRGLSSLRYDIGTRRAQLLGGQVTLTDGILIIAGAALGFLLGDAVTSALASMLGIQDIGTSLPLLLLWLTAIIGVPTAVVAGHRWITRRVKAAQLRRADLVTRRRELNTANRCMCWETAIVADDLARAYQHQHLLQASLSTGALDRLDPRTDAKPQVLVCPDTSALWLSVEVSPEGATLLLRGPMPTKPPTAPGDLPVGFYL